MKYPKDASSAMPRLTRAESQARTREHVLQAAAVVFARRGFHAASIDEVADDANYTKGAVYPYTALNPNMPWQLSADYDLCASKMHSNYCKYGWASFHGAGLIQFVFGDGSVKVGDPSAARGTNCGIGAVRP